MGVMIKNLSSILKHPTSMAVIINTVGNYLNVFFSAFFVILLTRLLSRSEYGAFSVLFGITFVLANVLDFGTTATIYSYLPGLIATQSNKAYRFIKSTFFYQTLFSLIVVAVLIALFPALDLYFFKTKAPIATLWITAVAVLFFIWQNFLSNCLYVAKRILQVNLYTLYANIVKTVAVLILAWTGHITVGIVIFMFGIVGPVVFFIFVYASKKNHLSAIMNAEIDRSDFRIRYTLTYFIASQFFNLGQRMDLFLMSYFRPQFEVGYYGLAQKIILTIIATIVSITQVISPTFAAVHTKKELRPHLRSGLMYMLIPTAIFIAVIFTPTFIFELILTKKFDHTAEIARLMALVYIPYSFMSLFHLFLLYTVKKPLYILYTNLVLFAVITGGCILSIPRFGAYGAIASLGVGFVGASILLILLAAKEYQRLPA